MQEKKEQKNEAKNLKARPPVVVVMGHVDHGKTTLLDHIRKTNVAGREAGGITQAVGAYEITHGGRKITFIDTPGHEAFTAMRSRGATIADLAVLVVAADDGVKPQTKEAIKILEETKTAFIVALNKIDKVGGGNLEKVKGDLAANGVLLEGYGGQVSYHGISAKTGEGVNDLLDLILLTADVEDLKYDPSAPATGFVLEVRREPQRGIEATVIIKEGTLKRGDMVVTPSASGKAKILENFLEKVVDNLEPSAPAVIIGFETLPKVGEEFTVDGVKQAAVAKVPAKAATVQPGVKKPATLNLMLKASDGGSLEVLSLVLSGIKAVRGREVKIIEESVGDITDGDVKHAQATESTIIGFKNRVTGGAKTLADAQSITIITSKIVYELQKAVEDFLLGEQGPDAAAELEVLAIFSQEKPEKQLIGGRVMNGTFRPKTSFSIVRPIGDGDSKKPLALGKVLGLREKKAEIFQAEKGKEIGALVSAQIPIQIGDHLITKK